MRTRCRLFPFCTDKLLRKIDTRTKLATETNQPLTKCRGRGWTWNRERQYCRGQNKTFSKSIFFLVWIMANVWLKYLSKSLSKNKKLIHGSLASFDSLLFCSKQHYHETDHHVSRCCDFSPINSYCFFDFTKSINLCKTTKRYFTYH